MQFQFEDKSTRTISTKLEGADVRRLLASCLAKDAGVDIDQCVFTVKQQSNGQPLGNVLIELEVNV